MAVLSFYAGSKCVGYDFRNDTKVLEQAKGNYSAVSGALTKLISTLYPADISYTFFWKKFRF